MNICIIGGGFYGCFLATKFSDKNKITLFEKSSEIFGKSSAIMNNQHRLHIGYHYPRSVNTIDQTIECYHKFLNEFGDFCFIPNNNYYLIHKDSKVSKFDFLNLYKEKELKFEEVDIQSVDILNKDQFECVIKTEEGVISNSSLKSYFEKSISNNENISLVFDKTIKDDDIDVLKEQYDLVINCTYNYPNIGLKNPIDIKHEYCALLLVKDTFDKNDCFTIMDGNFVSVYSTDGGYHTISSVLNTPFFKTKSLKDDIKYDDILSEYENSNSKQRIIDDLRRFFDIKDENIIGEYLTLKTKISNDEVDDNRESMIFVEDNYVSILCGKISAVYDIHSQIKDKFNI